MHSPQCFGSVLFGGQPSVPADFTRTGHFLRIRSSFRLLSCLLAFVLGLLTQGLRAAEITTDYWDYPPFSEVVITGSGFQAGEEVQLRLETLGEDGVTWSALPDDPVWPNPWTVTADAGGGILDTWLVYTEEFLGVSFRLTATGSQSNESAVANFTDAAGAYSINFAAADPAIYIPPIPFPEDVTAIVGRGNGDAQIPSAWFESPDTNTDVKVESLAPDAMALHQVVPFEIKITVDGSTSPENGTITFKAGWGIKTTSSEDFGYDETYGVLAAFVDTGDGAHDDPGGDATVSSFSWAIVGDEIVGTFEISGLDDGDVVVIEPWLVLEDTIPTGASKPTGNVQSRLISAETVPKGDKAISTGNQTVPLKPGEFFRASADLEITKSADPVCLGEDLTYTIVVTNNSTDTVANEIVVTDTLGANQTFVSSDGAPASVLGQVVTFDVGALAAGDSIELTVVVTPTAGGSVENDVVVTAITDDPEEANNSDSTETDVYSLPACEITLDSILVLGHTATFKSDAGLGTYAWSVSFNDGDPVDVDADVVGEVEIEIPEDATKGTVYLTVTNANGCESKCELDLEAFETDCDTLLPPTCPGIDQELELELTPPDGSEIVWSIAPEDGAAVLEVDPEDETKATVSSATCAQYTVTVTVTPPGGSATTCEISGSFEDSTNPELPELPAGGYLGCNPPPPTCDDTLEATDDCGPIPVTCSAGEVTNDGCMRSQTFTYSAEDACGNKASDTVTYTWKEDTVDPVLPTLPAGGDLGCNPEELPTCTTGLEGTDNCDGTVEVKCSAGEITGEGCAKSQIFTYSAKDDCDNEASDTVTYTWTEDTTDPELPTLPTGGDLGCNPEELPACVEGLMADDNCGQVEVKCSAGEITGEGCAKSQIFTYSAEDACGNKVSDTVTYIWSEDTEKPVLPDLPKGEDLGCNPDLPECVEGLVANDVCTGEIDVVCTPGEITGEGCEKSQTFTYSAEDACGNKATGTVTYTWTEDEEDPEITCPPEMLVAFPGVPAPATTVEELEELGGSASDTCSEVTISSTDSEPTGNCPRTFTRTYKAIDACNNESTCEQTITQYCPSLVTSSSLCTFDMDKECEDAFRLAFHQRGDSPSLYKITNTNPGQFYYNVFLSGNEGDPVDLSVTIPYPFVTHGAQPIHVYSDYTVTGSDETGYCLVPGTQAPGFTIGTAKGVDNVQNYSQSGAAIIVLGDYSLAAQTTTVTVNGGTIPASGTLVVTIHLDFGLKATKEWTPVSGAAVGSGAFLGVQIDPCEAYAFSFADAGLGLDDEQVVHSVNSFKKNPGFGTSIALKPDLGGSPLKGVKFEAWNATGTTKLGEGFTDADGAGMISYKHKSKPDDYWIKVPAYQKSIKVTVKANGFGMGEFEVP